MIYPFYIWIPDQPSEHEPVFTRGLFPRRRGFYRKTVALLLLALVSLPITISQAQPLASNPAPMIVEDVRIDGLQRIDVGTVLTYIDVAPGDILNRYDQQQLMRRLWKTGYFLDVELFREDSTLVVVVKERPSIAEFNITGNKKIGEEELVEQLRKLGLASGRVYKQSLLDQVERELRQQYYSNGYYSVHIDTTVKEISDNRVNISVAIDEGQPASIGKINIVGNKHFEEKELLAPFWLQPSSWKKGWWSQKDQYSQTRLAADLETLTSHYLDRGFIDFAITSSLVSLGPEREKIYITIHVEEGEPYRLESSTISGEFPVAREELEAYLDPLEEGSAFSRRQAQQIAHNITVRLGENGYAFARINPVPTVDEKQHLVHLNFVIEPGKRVYVHRVLFSGNERTNDEVLRREMRQFEGAPYSTSDIARSRVRLARLPYIEQVQVETEPLKGSNDLVDVRYTVVERNAGTLQFGLGYSGSQGIFLDTSVTNSNFFGTGRRVEVALNDSEYSQLYRLSLTNPYFTPEGVSQSIYVFFRSYDALNREVSEYDSEVIGTGLNFNVPVGEYDAWRLGLGYRGTSMTVYQDDSPNYVQQFVAENGDEFDALTLQTGWIHDTRNRSIFADRGMLARAFFDVAIPVLDLEYFTVQTRYLQYIPIIDALLGAWKVDVAYGESYGDTSDLPPYEKYFGGGMQTVRGFSEASLGPRDNFNNPTGGNFRVSSQSELIFPTLIPNNRSIRFSLFVDIGGVFADADDFDESELRASAGISMRWLTPVLGLLQFSLSTPLRDKPDDETDTFGFIFGVPF